MTLWQQLTHDQQTGIGLLALAIAFVILVGAYIYAGRRERAKAEAAEQRRQAARARTRAAGTTMARTGSHPAIPRTAGRYDDRPAGPRDPAAARPQPSTRAPLFERVASATVPPPVRQVAPLMAGIGDDQAAGGHDPDTDEVTAAWLTPVEDLPPRGEPTGPVEIVDPFERPSARRQIESTDSTSTARIASEAIALNIDQAERIGNLEQQLATAAAINRALRSKLAVSYVDPMLSRLQVHGQPMTLAQLAAAAGCEADSSEIRRRIMAAMMYGVLRAHHEGVGDRDETVRYSLASWQEAPASLFDDDDAHVVAERLAELEPAR